MIIENGTILYQSGVNGLDKNGNPIKNISVWSTPIPCWVKYNNSGKLGITNEGNHFESASYIIQVETLLGQIQVGQIVKIIRDDIDLGEFKVQGLPERLTAVDCYQILVR